MLGFLKRSLEYNKLAIAFTRLYNAVGAIEHDHEMSIEDDDEKLTIELTILAVWIEENVFEVLAKGNISLDETIFIQGLGGFKKVRYFMNLTVGRIMKLSVDAGVEDEIQGILEGGRAYYEAKGHLKEKFGK